MPRRNRQDALYVGIAAGASIVGGIAWAWYNLKGAVAGPERREDLPVGENKRLRKGSRPIAVLATSILPPPYLISQLSDSYTLHLVLPSSSDPPPPLPDIYRTTSFDAKRLLHHSTPEGLTHLVRTVGGTLVYVLPAGLEGEKVDGDTELGESEVVSLVKDVRTFTDGIVLVCAEGKGEDLENLLEAGKERRGVEVVQGWGRLGAVMG